MRKKMVGIMVLTLVILPMIPVAAIEERCCEDKKVFSQDVENTGHSVNVRIVRPRPGFLYIHNREILYIGFTTLVIGPRNGIDVWVEVEGVNRSNIKRIEFLSNEEVIGIGTWSPFRQYYTWRWNENCMGTCNLKAVAVGITGALSGESDEITLQSFNIKDFKLIT